MSNQVTALANTIDITAPTQPTYTNGRALAFPDGEEPSPSSLLRYLPAIYSADPFVGRFLRIFEDVLEPISVMVDNQPYYFDPMTTPLELLDYMAIWVDMDDEGSDWPLPKRRALIAAAAALYRMRGTQAGLKKHLGIYIGAQPLVMERTNGFRLTPDARLGINTSMGENRARTITVTVAVHRPEELDQDTMRSIVEQNRPVETNFILRIVKLRRK
jgi:phage tail-like protein